MSRLKLTMCRVNKEHGKGTMGGANFVRPMKRLSTGSLSFDRALGGGIAVGRTTILRGSESSGKTTNALRTIGLAQSLCSNCYRPVSGIETIEEVDDDTGEVIFVAKGHCDCVKTGVFSPRQYNSENDSDYNRRVKGYEKNSYDEFRVVLFNPEGDYDIEWAEKIGVDNKRLLCVTPDTAEETGDIYDAVMRTGEVDLMVLDSIAAMTPSVEVEESLENWQQGLQARLVGKFTRKAQAASNVVYKEYGRLVTQIWINQLRLKIGMVFGDNRVMSGGEAQKYAASTIIDLWPSKWEKETRDKDLIKEHQSEAGTRVRINFKVLKNKTAPALQSGSYDMFVEGEVAGKIDEIKYFIAMAGKVGLYREEGEGTKKRWYVGNEEYKAKKDAIARIADPKVYAEMRKIILSKMLDR